jgi:flagellar hook-associated protein 2
VNAQIVNTGDAGAPFKIVLTGTSGAANDFTMTSQAMPGSPTISTTQGSSTTGSLVTEASTVAFGTGLAVGQSMTVGGLTYTATSAVSATELASAFASLAVGATSGQGTGKGSYSGSLIGFSTGAVVGGNSITATSSTPSTDVTDLRVAGTAAASGIPALAAVAGLDFSNITQAASSAALTVDGVAVTSNSNQVQDAISGVTLSLNAKTTLGTPATISFSRDTSAVTTKLQALVTAYNDAVTMLGVVSDPKSTVADYGASLVGNSIVGQVRGQIRTMMLGGAAANAPASGSVTALRDLGVSIDSKGVLTLDTTKLNTTLSSNFDNAVTMLSANQENQSTYSTLDGGVAGDAVKKLTSMLSSAGSISTNSANATTKIANYKKDLATLEDRMT